MAGGGGEETFDFYLYFSPAPFIEKGAGGDIFKNKNKKGAAPPPRSLSPPPRSLSPPGGEGGLKGRKLCFYYFKKGLQKK